MNRFAWLLGLALPGLGCAAAMAADPQPAVIATVEATGQTNRDHVRQFAFDGDNETFYESADEAANEEQFTLALDKPVRVASIAVSTGRPDGSAILKAATLEVADLEGNFRSVGQFVDGQATASGGDEPISALRIRVEEDQEEPLVLREIVLDSEPSVVRFKYPVEIFVDVTDAPEMEKWARHTARLCERQYPLINEELASEGFTPPHAITMRLTPDYDGVAATMGTHIVGSVDYFTRRPDDTGAMVHETAHVVQAYRSRRNPRWLVEGVADYVRFVKYEPENIGGFDPRRARHDQSYRTSARFLDYLAKTYDKQIVRKLNQVMREGKYREEVFEELTGKTLADLGAEWTTVINAPANETTAQARRDQPHSDR